MIPSTENKTKNETRAGHAQINVKVPAHVRAQFQREADRRCEDLATTVRRHLYQSLSRDQVDARLEALERKLDALLVNAPEERLSAVETQMEAYANAAIEMERQFKESVSALVWVRTNMEKLATIYNKMADYLTTGKG